VGVLLACSLFIIWFLVHLVHRVLWCAGVAIADGLLGRLESHHKKTGTMRDHGNWFHEIATPNLPHNRPVSTMGDFQPESSNAASSSDQRSHPAPTAGASSSDPTLTAEARSNPPPTTGAAGIPDESGVEAVAAIANAIRARAEARVPFRDPRVRFPEPNSLLSMLNLERLPVFGLENMTDAAIAGREPPATMHETLSEALAVAFDADVLHDVDDGRISVPPDSGDDPPEDDAVA
jgi:hypothetical protein